MPRQTGFQVENNFTKGLITEATGLNFPENACTETYDCVFSEKGKATRRQGWDYEGNFSTFSVNRTGSVIVEYLWSAAGGDGATNIVVVQVGSTLYYYEAVENGALSGNKFSFTTNLLTYQVTGGSDVKGNICQFASGNGFLFVVHPLCEPFYVSFNPSGPSKTETAITVRCRDLDGDKTDTDYSNYEVRPTTITNPHHYNLYNQGWYFAANTSTGYTSPSVTGTAVVYTTWDTAFTNFPSNADIWWLSKDGQGNFNLSYLDQSTTGNTPAPKGHYIIKEFATDRTSLSGITAVERDSNGQRPSTISFFAGRVWYAGVADQEYNQKIYYSQIIDSTENFGKCYQQNDPTSEEVSDLLPSDGGYIIIPDVGAVIKIFPMASSLLVFARNGVWSIAGSEGIGFKATDYAVRKLSAVESLSALSFVDVYGIPIWWNTDGIFTVGGSDNVGNESVTSISDDTIKAFLADIPSESKMFVKGAFNPRTKIVQWVYRNSVPASIEESYTYDKVLNFNILSKAFYPWTISQSAASPLVHGIIVSKGPASEPVALNVIDVALDQVVDSNGLPVVVGHFAELGNSFAFRYYTTKNTAPTAWDATFSQASSTSYLDWTAAGSNIDYTSYFFTGYKVHGEGIRFFENGYLTITMTTEDNASCFLQAVWDYANSPSGARFTNAQQVYIARLLRDIEQTRKKIRGRGRSLHFKFYSETGKPFTIHGWSAWETQDAGV